MSHVTKHFKSHIPKAVVLASGGRIRVGILNLARMSFHRLPWDTQVYGPASRVAIRYLQLIRINSRLKTKQKNYQIVVQRMVGRLLTPKHIGRCFYEYKLDKFDISYM